MANSHKERILKDLIKIGIKNTVLTVREGNVFSAHTFKTAEGRIRLVRAGSFTDPNAPIIGRVGLPDPELGILWQRSMTFYGRWFDELAVTDSDYTLRNKIISLSRHKLLNQIQRDDKFGVVGSYYSVLLKVMDVKHSVPLVLYDDSLLSLNSFPVILPNIEDKTLRNNLAHTLRLLLGKGRPQTEKEAEKEIEKGIEKENRGGIEVDEVAAEDVAKYFPQQ